jgi:hypothetical protein
MSPIDGIHFEQFVFDPGGDLAPNTATTIYHGPRSDEVEASGIPEGDF